LLLLVASDCLLVVFALLCLRRRDFWSDECVKDMVQCSFVFWQKLDVTPEGSTYVQYYKVRAYSLASYAVAVRFAREHLLRWQYWVKQSVGLPHSMIVISSLRWLYLTLTLNPTLLSSIPGGELPAHRDCGSPDGRLQVAAQARRAAGHQAAGREE
jgi:hypothetical protein